MSSMQGPDSSHPEKVRERTFGHSSLGHSALGHSGHPPGPARPPELAVERSGEFPAITSPDEETAQRHLVRAYHGHMKAEMLEDLHVLLPEFVLTRADSNAIARMIILLGVAGSEGRSKRESGAPWSSALSPEFGAGEGEELAALNLATVKTPREARAEVREIISVATENLIYLQANMPSPRGLGKVFGTKTESWPRIAPDDPFAPLVSPQLNGERGSVRLGDFRDIRQHELGLSLYLLRLAVRASARVPELLDEVRGGLVAARQAIAKDAPDVRSSAAANFFLIADLSGYVTANPFRGRKVREFIKVIGITNPAHIDAFMRDLYRAAAKECGPFSPLRLFLLGRKIGDSLRAGISWLEKLG